LERIRLDLSDVQARREEFKRIASQAQRALIITEGLLIYLSDDEVAALATELASHPSFQRWIIDLSSPGLLRIKMKQLQAELSAAGSPLKFAPEAGLQFFEPCGWVPAEVRSLLKTAAKLKRLSWKLRLLSLIPEPKGPPGSRPWGGVCLLKRA
jgi:O-methyltransferase involved in polyketide biosynthesis